MADQTFDAIIIGGGNKAVVPENSYAENRVTFAFWNTIPRNLKDQTGIISQHNISG